MTRFCAILCIILFSNQSYAVEPLAARFKAIAFDYFIIFDPNSVYKN